MTWTSFDKAIVAALPLVLMVLGSLGAMGLSANAMYWVNLAVAVLTPVLVYLKKNAPPA
jgi:hypothetical protein